MFSNYLRKNESSPEEKDVEPLPAQDDDVSMDIRYPFQDNSFMNSSFNINSYQAGSLQLSFNPGRYIAPPNIAESSFPASCRFAQQFDSLNDGQILSSFPTLAPSFNLDNGLCSFRMDDGSFQLQKCHDERTKKMKKELFRKTLLPESHRCEALGLEIPPPPMPLAFGKNVSEFLEALKEWRLSVVSIAPPVVN